jgi:hypothetical protein
MRGVVTDMRTLKGMAVKGLIKLHPHTGKKVRHWSGQMIPCRYIDDVTARIPFEYKGVKYTRKFFDGCIMPFVVRIDAELPSFV